MLVIFNSVLLAGLLSVRSAWAQTPLQTVVVSPPPRPAIMGGVSLGSFKMPAVKGQPYSLVSKTTIVKAAADGTPVTTVREERKMRDAEGRERTEIVLPNGGVIVPHITDPVAQMTITLFPGSKTAYVTRIPLPPPPTPEQEAKATELRARVEEYRKAHPLSPDTDSELQLPNNSGRLRNG